MIPACRAVLSLAVLLCTAASVAQAPPPQTSPGQTITIDLLVDSEYDDSEESLGRIRELIALGFHELVHAPSRSALDKILFQRYDFGPTRLPSTWGALSSAIDRINAGRGEGDPWRVPSIPRRRRTKLSPDNPYYDLPRVALYTCNAITAVGFDVSQSGTTEEKDRKGSRYTLVQITMPRAGYDLIAPRLNAGTLMHGVSRQFASVSPPTVREVAPEPATVPLQQVETTARTPERDPGPDGLLGRTPTVAREVSRAPASTPSPAPREWRLFDDTTRERLRLSQKLAGANRRAFLIVLDFGWPDADEMRRSLKLIEAAINRRRGKLGIPAISIPIPDSAKVSFTTHSADVKLAIAELTAADVNRAVEVLYLPITLDAITEPLFRELFEIDFFVRYLPQDPRVHFPNVGPLTESAVTWAKSELLAWKLVNQQASDPHRIQAVILNALYRLFETLSSAENTVFVVNQSWTIRGHILDLATTSRAFTVCATGNDGFDVLASNIDFAQRSAHDDGFLAVINSDPDGTVLCGSGILPTAKVPLANVVAFDGTLPNGRCGTSYAAPRIAWFIAAKAAIAVTIDDTWHKEIQRTLKVIRPGGQIWRSIYFDAVRFLEH
jgi:hypothetical protein